MEMPRTTYQVELGVSRRYAQAYGWVVNAITGWLSAYYMEDPRFRVSRRYEDLETGIHIWLCEVEDGLSMRRIIKRLQADVPPYRVHEKQASAHGHHRYVIDLPEAA